MAAPWLVLLVQTRLGDADEPDKGGADHHAVQDAGLTLDITQVHLELRNCLINVNTGNGIRRYLERNSQWKENDLSYSYVFCDPGPYSVSKITLGFYKTHYSLLVKYGPRPGTEWR